jgi:hypothetical protein
LFYRPNVPHAGNALPIVYIHKLAADLKHRQQTGLIGCDFDSLLHHWSTQGIDYYVLAKLFWDLAVNVDEVLEDYVRSAFGPAAAIMKEHFLAVERNTDEMAARFSPGRQERDAFLRAAPGFFPDQVLEAWRVRLRQALAAAPRDSDYARRIRWIMDGVDYAELTLHLLAATMREGGPAAASHPEIGSLGARRDAWLRAHLYDWTIFGPVMYFREAPAPFGR